MAVDLVMLAKRRREGILAELAEVDAFLATADKLIRTSGDSPQAAPAAKTKPSAAPRGVGADTVAVSLEIVRAYGPQATRDLLPMVKDRGIPVGGKSEIATLSARLSTTGKGVLQMIDGKWHEVEVFEAPGSEATPEREESADQSVAGQPADSLFNQTKEGGEIYAAALV